MKPAILDTGYILIDPKCSNKDLRELIFQGKILQFTNCKTTRVLVEFAINFLKENLKEESLQEFEHIVSKEEFHQKLSRLKTIFSNLPETKEYVKKLLVEIDFDLETNYFDLVRLRSITSYAHTLKEAKPAFAIHRDTWYGNPQSQINWWLPIFDVSEKDTFAFYPDYFTKPVKNNSNEFGYKSWNSSGGFQSSTSDESRIFPELKEKINRKTAIKIPCQASDLLLFSASHLHGTTPNNTNRTRFSLDFRTVDLEDVNKSGAKKVDNFSKGSILEDMISAKTFERFQFQKYWGEG